MGRLTQIIELGKVLSLPGARRALFKWKPFSITSFRMLHALRKWGPAFHTIIDGGANKGQFARAAAEFYPDARIYSFEPLPDVAAQLRANLADLSNVRIFEIALGASEDTISFYRHDYTLASSALPPSPSERAEVKSIEVKQRRLDDVLTGEDLKSPLLLKLDLQGYELEALRGGKTVLGRSDYVLIETGFDADAEGVPTFGDVDAFLRSAGFRFIRPVDVLYGRHQEIVQMDALYERDPERAGG